MTRHQEPHHTGNDKPRNPKVDAMTLRDRIALEVLPAIYNEYFWSVRENQCGVIEGWRTCLAIDAYALADAMLAERERNHD